MIPADTIRDWASFLVSYSLEVEDGDLVQIQYAEPAKPLAQAVYRELLEVGAHPIVDRDDSTFSRIFYDHADEDQLTHIPDYQKEKVEAIDASLRIRAPTNTKELSGVDPKQLQTASKARQPLKEEIIENTTWSLTQYPTAALAQEAEMGTEAYQDFAIDACVKDWEAEARRYRELKQLVDAGSTVEIEGYKTDLTFEIGERDRINRIGTLSDGTSNVPGGEVFTAPIKDTVNGQIHFELPAIRQGNEVVGVTLTFENGKVIDFEAEKNEQLLEESLQTDEGASFLGEFGIGTNFAIDRFTKNILFDEKIGGTIHLALGSAYRDCYSREIALDVDGADQDRLAEIYPAFQQALRDGRFDAFVEDHDGIDPAVFEELRERWEALEETEDEQYNESAVHWDMIKDLREQGEMRIDGETILKEGRFVGVPSLLRAQQDVQDSDPAAETADAEDE